MSEEAIISTDQRSGRVAPPNTAGFYANWGPQAWIDMWMSNTMLVKKAMPIVSHTFVPILRLSGDKEQVDRDYDEIKSRREIIRWNDSPREKWRKRYGNFVREAEWALLELRKYYSQKQFEEIVIGTSVALSYETSADFLNMMNSMSDKNAKKAAKASNDGPKKPSRWSRFMFETFNPAHWLTGPATITQFDPSQGLTEMFIPECGWHTCGPADRLPNPNALPEEGCLHICKGPFEALFKGEGGGLKMEFEPHLPETSCTVRMSWQTN
ncbi:hypothetical protein [Candidatus Marimicrobium litorale]|uniref:Uncharacterized protein n=1 Tax=Candidatus Marimicrobium litorale TaxID=2518991 RepID=A0ABT3T3B6_9GAMM|nr:hypothetical protein [Candidatus Marimicrobium litorale]MCX2976766.1 hypothetical protein [Candidatus Marimicrobium litorale]